MSAARAGSVTLSNLRAANVVGTGNLKSGLVATGTSVSISALSRTLVDSNAPKKLELVAGIGPPSVKLATCSCSGRRGSPSELFLNVFALRDSSRKKYRPLPRKVFEPLLVLTFTRPPDARPYSAEN